jgi:Protein of unknown function (DUF3297)
MPTHTESVPMNETMSTSPAIATAPATAPATTTGSTTATSAAAPAGHAKPPLPDRLSTEPRSPHYLAAVFEHDIGIRFNGKDRSDVDEYCISEGWIKVPAGKAIDRKGQPLLIKLKGTVEAYYR